MQLPSWLGGRGNKEAEAAAAAARVAAEQALADAAAAEEAARQNRSVFSRWFGAKPPPPVSWPDSLNKTNWEHYMEPRSWLPPALAVGAALGFSAFYRSYLRRIPGTNHIQPRYFRRRSLLGKVTSVGDGDNFHLFHTPGGRLAGWGWLRTVPKSRKELRGKTIPVRIAGVDAPEGAHFGKPAQPYSGEALEFLQHYINGRRVRAYLFRRDQYDRVVARVIVRRFWFFKRDVGMEMLKRGLATCYDAKSGAEFGGREMEYRVAEAKAKARKHGLWSGGPGRANETSSGGTKLKAGQIETPREYKNRTATEGDAATATTSSATSTPVAAAKAIASVFSSSSSSHTASKTTHKK